MSIFQRYAAFALALALLSGALAGALVHRYAGRAAADDGLRRLGEAARARAETVGERIRVLREDTLLLSREAALGRIEERAPRQHLESVFRELIRARRHYLRAELTLLNEGELDEMAVERRHGTIRPADPKRSTTRPDSAWLREVRNAPPGEVRLFAMSPASGGTGTCGGSMLRASVALPDREAGAAAVISLIAEPGPLLGPASASLTTPAFACLTDGRGRVLLHAQAELLADFDFPHLARVQDGFPDLASFFAPGSRAVELAFMSSERELGLESTGWRDRGVELGILLLAAGLGLSVPLGRRLMRPLHQMTRAFSRVADGEVDVELPLGASGELGSLARAFHSMLETLDERGQALQVSELRSRSILEGAPDGIIGIDERGLILYANKAAEQLVGYDSGELIGLNVQVLMPESEARQHQGYLERYLLTGVSHVIGRGRELEAVRRDGTLVPVHLTVSEVQLDGRRSFTGILRDVTERRRAQRELEQAKERAEAAAVAKSQFLANMSHELRTPLNGVVGAAELLAEEDLAPDQHELVQIMQRSAHALLGLVDDVLDFSKIEAGRLVLERTAFNLEALVSEAVAMLSLAAAEKGLLLRALYPSDAPRWFIGDPLRLRQAVLNLGSNAIKFTERGQVEIRVECEALGETHAQMRIEVADTGIGIPADALDCVFGEFTQADDSMTRRFGGTGLGLAITKRLLELCGGSVSVQSQVGEGSTFQLSLPLTLAPEKPETSAEAAAPPVEGFDVQVLVVDDVPVNQLLAEKMLEKLGCRVEIASTGREAVERLAAGPVDLVLMDCQMPDMDGFEATERIRRLEPAGKRTPIVAMTTDATHEDRNRCLAVGMDDHLSKPVDLASLRAVLMRWSDAGAGQAQSER